MTVAPTRGLDRVELRLDGDSGQAGMARRFVQVHLSLWAVAETAVEAAVLLASELVADAVREGSVPVSVSVERAGFHITVAVRDAPRGQAERRRTTAADQTRGGGLRLVKLLSSAWGYQPVDGGALTWFRLGGGTPRR